MKLGIIDKIRLAAKINSTINSVEEGIAMKNSTKVIASIVSLLTLALGLHPVQVAIAGFLTTHPVVAAVIAAISTLVALIHNPVADPTQAASGSKIVPMILLFLAFGMLSLSTVRAQAVPPADGNNMAAVGMNYSVNASPSLAGSLLYARLLLPSTDTWAFTNADFLPNTLKPFTVTNNVGAGVAQKIATFGTVPVYCITAAGVSWTGTNTGFQFNGGCIASIKYKGFLIMPDARFLKSSVSNGTSYQPILGAYIGKRW
jgi:hypothetical protein